MSVIAPGQDKGKSYIEHTAAKAGTSYKARLKAAIDRLIPACKDLEDLLSRLQREGYEIKCGKYISCRASDQERFTRLKTLGIDYTEEAISYRIAGGTRPSRKPKQRDDKIKLLMDIQSKQGAGLKHWAKLQNLKEAAKTVNFLTEHGISSYEELESKLAVLTDTRDRSLASIKETESRIADLSLIDKYATTYRKYKPLYEKYKRSPDKEKFLRGHESKIILFEAAARELKRLGAVPIPSADLVEAELAELAARKDTLYTGYDASKQQLREMETIKQNIDSLLLIQKGQELKRSHEIE